MRGDASNIGPLYTYSIDSNGGSQVSPHLSSTNHIVSVCCLAYHTTLIQVLWTRETPDSTDQTGVWRQVKVNIPTGSYKFIFASFLNDESDRGDKAIDDVEISEGSCSDLPGLYIVMTYLL